MNTKAVHPLPAWFPKLLFVLFAVLIATRDILTELFLHEDAISLAFLVTATIAGISCVGIVCSGRLPSFLRKIRKPQAIKCSVILGVIMAIAFGVGFFLIKKIGAGLFNLVDYGLTPLLTAGIGVLFFKEKLRPGFFISFLLYLIGIVLIVCELPIYGLKWIALTMIIPVAIASSDGLTKWLLDPQKGHLDRLELLVVRFAPAAILLAIYANLSPLGTGIHFAAFSHALAVAVICGFIPLYLLCTALGRQGLTELAVWEFIIPAIAFFATLPAHWADHARLGPILGALIILSSIIFSETAILEKVKTLFKNKSIKKTVVLVDPVSSGIGLIQLCLDHGFRPMLLITFPVETVRSHWPELGAYLFTEDTKNYDIIFASTPEQALQLLQATSSDIVGVIPGSEQGVICADYLARQMNLPGNDPALSIARRDKAQMKLAVAAQGLRVAQHCLCNTAAEALHFAEKIGYPIILKTPASSGGELVRRCNNETQLNDAFFEIQSSVTGYGMTTEAVLAEEFLVGTEYIVNLFANGERIQATDIWEYRKISQGENAHLYYDIFLRPYSSAAKDTQLDQMIEYSIAASQALGIHVGPIHAEIMWTASGPIMVEIGSRLSGGKIPQQVGKFSNFNPLTATFDVFTTGKCTIPHNIEFTKYLWITFHPVPQCGIIKSIHGIEKIQGLPGYKAHSIHIKVGDVLKPTVDLFNIPMVCWLTGDTLEQVRAQAEIAHAEFQVVCE